MHRKCATALKGKDSAGVQMMLQNRASEFGRSLPFDEVIEIAYDAVLPRRKKAAERLAALARCQPFRQSRA